MWSTAFHDVAESILGVSVEDFEELNDDQREDCRLARHRDAVQHDNAKNCRWSVHKLHG